VDHGSAQTAFRIIIQLLSFYLEAVYFHTQFKEVFRIGRVVFKKKRAVCLL